MPSNPLKSGRIELRTDRARAKRIRLAASMAQQSVSTFMLEAATERADQVIAKAQEIVVPANYFDAFWKALSTPSHPNRRLAALARRTRRFTQRW